MPLEPSPSNYKQIQTNSSTKTLEEFRAYTQNDRVVEHYRDMRQHQTVEFYDRMAKKYSFESKSCVFGWQRAVGFSVAATLKLMLTSCCYLMSDGKYRKLMTIEEAFVELENYIDASDPDLDLVSSFA